MAVHNLQCCLCGRPLSSTVAPQRHSAHCIRGVLCGNGCLIADCFSLSLKPEACQSVDRNQGVTLKCFKATGMKSPLAQCSRGVTIDAPEEGMLKHCTFQVLTINTMKTRTCDAAFGKDMKNVCEKGTILIIYRSNIQKVVLHSLTQRLLQLMILSSSDHRVFLSVFFFLL